MAKSPVNTLPRALPLLTGMTAGVFAAFVVQVLLGNMGMSVATAWTQLTSGAQLRFASASVLWAIAGTAFVAGVIAARLLVKLPPPWRNFRAVRWIVGAVVTFGLAYLAHEAGPPHDVPMDKAVVADIAAIVIAGLMALLGASFARIR
jgi:hypothetical protein